MTIVGWIVAGGLLAAITTAGAGLLWYYNTAYSAGKKSAKLNQTEKDLADARQAGNIMVEPRTPDDTRKRLDDASF